MGRSRRFRLKLMKCVLIPRVLSAASFGSKSLKHEFPSIRQQEEERWCDDDDDDIHEEEDGNKIMVVLNSSLEAKCALDWALTHAVQPQDSVLLLHLLNNKPSSSQGRDDMNKVVVDMKKECQMKRAGVKVRVVKVEAAGEEEGRAIVEEAKQQRVTLLVIGQRKRKRCVWRGLLRRLIWANGKSRAAGNYNGSSALADYCIRNASCMTIAVRRNNNKLGGYLITTKRHQNFWLLA